MPYHLPTYPDCDRFEDFDIPDTIYIHMRERILEEKRDLAKTASELAAIDDLSYLDNDCFYAKGKASD